jgi:hypothetical protein
MLAEARLEQSLRFVTAPLREARLHEVARATNLSRMQRAQYYLNGLELDALPNPGPIRYWCLVWAVAVAYCGLCSAYLWGEFLARRGAALVSMWVVACAVSLAQEVFVVAPLKTLLLHVLAPRLVEPALLNVEEGEAMHAFKDAMTRGLDLAHAVQVGAVAACLLAAAAAAAAAASWLIVAVCGPTSFHAQRRAENGCVCCSSCVCIDQGKEMGTLLKEYLAP